MNFPAVSDILKLTECLYSTSTRSLQQEANRIITKKTGAELAFILHVSKDLTELSCKVIGEKILTEEIYFVAENSCFHNVILKKESIILNKIKEDCSAINNSCDVDIKTILCVPMLVPEAPDKVTNIVCLANKNVFTTGDLELVKTWTQYLSPLLFKAQAFSEEHKIRTHSESLLLVVKTLLLQIDNVTLLLKEIMTEALKLTKAERCSLFLLDNERNELVAKVFDGHESDEESKDIRLPASEGIAGHVASSGKTLNIHDAYSHPLFYSKMDETTGFKTRNILCFPIKDESGVIGVAQLCNKINGKNFSYFDEEIANNFSVYCAICLMHSLTWKKAREEQSRSRWSNGLLVQSNVSEEEVLQLIKSAAAYVVEKNFSTFKFIPRLLTDVEATQSAIFMFKDLGMTDMWRMKEKALSRYVVTVKQGYQDPPYHNWKHGFSVAHFAYLILKNLKLMGNQLSHLEGLALLIACLGHDLDHRGTTSSFQVACKSVIAALYSSEGSVLERHHFAQTVAILHMKGCDILENLTEGEYTKCLDHIRTIILATDLAHHFQILNDIRKMVKDGYDCTNPKHHELLLCLIVTSCDLSDQTKDWINTKAIAKLIFLEFFKQGDLEKAMGVSPSEMMDRTKAQIPQLQINFLQQVVLPVYQLLAAIFPEFKEIVDTVVQHRLQWEKVDLVFTRENLADLSPLDFLEDKRVDEAAMSVH